MCFTVIKLYTTHILEFPPFSPPCPGYKAKEERKKKTPDITPILFFSLHVKRCPERSMKSLRFHKKVTMRD